MMLASAEPPYTLERVKFAIATHFWFHDSNFHFLCNIGGLCEGWHHVSWTTGRLLHGGVSSGKPQHPSTETQSWQSHCCFSPAPCTHSGSNSPWEFGNCCLKECGNAPTKLRAAWSSVNPGTSSPTIRKLPQCSIGKAAGLNLRGTLLHTHIWIPSFISSLALEGTRIQVVKGRSSTGDWFGMPWHFSRDNLPYSLIK